MILLQLEPELLFKPQAPYLITEEVSFVSILR